MYIEKRYRKQYQGNIYKKIINKVMYRAIYVKSNKYQVTYIKKDM